MDPLNPQRRIATEQVIADVDGITTVVAEPGLAVPLAYDHLVPDDKATPIGDLPEGRSTAARRARGAALSSPPAAQPITADYGNHDAKALQAEANRRGLTVEGTGANGNVLKKDLEAALTAHDEKA